uniref:Uncharacterized protein n=1 Tax=viral metagenome TaxID=1070528 RepID=A0A6C0JVY2_9ZZZZ
MIVRNNQGMLFLVERRDYNTDIEYYNRIRYILFGTIPRHPHVSNVLLSTIHKSPL